MPSLEKGEVLFLSVIRNSKDMKTALFRIEGKGTYKGKELLERFPGRKTITWEEI